MYRIRKGGHYGKPEEKKETLSGTVPASLNSTLIADSEMFLRFLESLSSGQMSMLILSGALDNLGPKEEINAQDLGPAYPHPTERQGFDFEKWKNRPDPKIR